MKDGLRLGKVIWMGPNKKSKNYKSFVRPGHHCLSIVLERATAGYYSLRTGYLLFQNGLHRATMMRLYQSIILIFTGLKYGWVQTQNLSEIQVYC